MTGTTDTREALRERAMQARRVAISLRMARGERLQDEEHTMQVAERFLTAWAEEADAALAAPDALADPAPIDMVLHCPACGMQHVDASEPNDAELDRGLQNGWGNPPHRSHLCHGCGHVWRPADVPTNGVVAVKTKGKNDSPSAPEAPKRLDDPKLQEMFTAAIDGALTFGYQGVNPAPPGHWLEYWWQKGRAVAAREIAASPPADPPAPPPDSVPRAVGFVSPQSMEKLLSGSFSEVHVPILREPSQFAFVPLLVVKP